MGVPGKKIRYAFTAWSMALSTAVIIVCLIRFQDPKDLLALAGIVLALTELPRLWVFMRDQDRED